MPETNHYIFKLDINSFKFRVTVITGVCRSGKTLLGQLLGSMQNVEHIDEPWFASMLPIIQGKELINRKVARRLLQAYTEELFNDVILLRRANFRPKDKSSIWDSKSAQEIFSRLVNLYSRNDVRQYVHDNNSMLLYNLAETIPYISFFYETFPQCKVIHVIRNGLDVALEIAEKQWFSDAQLQNPLNNQIFRKYQKIKGAGEYYLPWWLDEEDSERFLDMEDFARGLCYWRSLLEQSQEQFSVLRDEHPEAYCEVKYEDLVQAPKCVLNKLASFLDVTPSERTASALSMIENKLNNDLSLYPLAQVSQRELKCAIQILDTFGYPTAKLKRKC